MKIFAAISSIGAILGDENLNLGVDPLKKSIFLKVGEYKTSEKK